MEAVYKALGDPHRIQMIMLLGQKDQTVDALRKEMGISQSSTSQHLKTLLQAGLVAYQRHGNFRIYSLQRERLRHAMSFFDGLWDRDLARLKSNLEDQNG